MKQLGRAVYVDVVVTSQEGTFSDCWKDFGENLLQ